MKFSALLPLAVGFLGAVANAQTCKTDTYMVTAVPEKDLSTYMQMLTYDNGKIYIGDIKWNSPTSELLLLTYPRTDGWTSFLSYHVQRYQDLTINPTNVTEAIFWFGNMSPPTGYTRAGFSIDTENYLNWNGTAKWYACPEEDMVNTYRLWYMGGDDAAANTPTECISIKLKAIPYGALST